jgi:hypothetical protein
LWLALLPVSAVPTALRLYDALRLHLISPVHPGLDCQLDLRKVGAGPLVGS